MELHELPVYSSTYYYYNWFYFSQQSIKMLRLAHVHLQIKTLSMYLIMECTNIFSHMTCHYWFVLYDIQERKL
jgi:hypothetical protein